MDLTIEPASCNTDNTIKVDTDRFNLLYLTTPQHMILIDDLNRYMSFYAKSWEDLYDITAWKIANAEFFKKIFNLETFVGVTPFKKQNLDLIKEEIHKLVYIIRYE